MAFRKKSVLPTNATDAAKVIRRNCDRLDPYLTMWRLNTMLATYYAAGYRVFDQLNPNTGHLVARFTETEDDKQTHSLGEGQLLYQVQQIMGFLGAMDSRPVATATIKTLDSLRQQGAANAILGSTYRPQTLEPVMTELDYNFAYLGFGCLHVSVEDHPSLGMYNELEVVHPFEVMPLPFLRIGQTNPLGVTRRRLLTRDSLVEVYGERAVKKLENDKSHRMFDLQAGDPMDFLDLSGTSLANYGQVYSFGTNVPIDNHVRVFEVAETWTYGPMNTVDRMMVSCGEVAIEDRNFEQTETYCPLVYRGCYENGTFWGAGHFTMAFGATRRAELLRKAVFRTLINQESWPVLLLPHGAVNERTGLGKFRPRLSGSDPAQPRGEPCQRTIDKAADQQGAEHANHECQRRNKPPGRPGLARPALQAHAEPVLIVVNVEADPQPRLSIEFSGQSCRIAEQSVQGIRQ